MTESKAKKLEFMLLEFVQKYYGIPKKFLQSQVSVYTESCRIILSVPVKVQSGCWSLSMVFYDSGRKFWRYHATVFKRPHDYTTSCSYIRTDFGKLKLSEDMKKFAKIMVRRLESGQETIFRYPKTDNRRPLGV